MVVNKKDQKSKDTRARILKSASELFLQGGLAALSVRAIANRAGLSTIGIYSHFDGKQGILDTLYIDAFERVALAMDVSNIDASPVHKVIASAQAYLRVADTYPAHYRLIFGEADDDYQPSIAAAEVAQRAFSLLIEGAGSLLTADASLSQKQKLALEIWAIVHGYVGLKNHQVSKSVAGVDWNLLAISALETHLSNLSK